jgi:hypothetical protein
MGSGSFWSGTFALRGENLTAGREPEPCFNSDMLPPDPTPEGADFTVSLDLQADAQTSPLLRVSSVGTAAVGFERGVSSCSRPPDILNAEQIPHCAIDDLAMNVSVQAVVPPGGETCNPDEPSVGAGIKPR